MPWSTPWAPTEAELHACVECGLCLPHCPTFRLTGDETASPRGRLNAMAAVATGEMPLDPSVAEVMEFCLQCRACEAACPSLVPFGRAMEGREQRWLRSSHDHDSAAESLGAGSPASDWCTLPLRSPRSGSGSVPVIGCRDDFEMGCAVCAGCRCVRTPYLARFTNRLVCPSARLVYSPVV